MVNLTKWTLVLLASSGSFSNFPSWMYERIEVIQVPLDSTCRTGISLILGFVYTSIIKPSSWVCCFDDAIQATSSASKFSSLGIWTNLISSKWLAIWIANHWYFCIRSSFVSYSWLTYLTMSLEPLMTTKLLTPKALTSLRLVSIASYSASLFVAGIWSCTPYLSTSLSGNIMTTHTPPNSLKDDPSAWTGPNYIWP